MHFHDSFIAHFFPVLSLSCCHKQTSAVLLLFIIHKSNKVASQDGARRHFRGVLYHSFLLLRPLSISISSFVSRIHLIVSPSSFAPTCFKYTDTRKWKRPLRQPLLISRFHRNSSDVRGFANRQKYNTNQIPRDLFSYYHRRKMREKQVDNA